MMTTTHEQPATATLNPAAAKRRKLLAKGLGAIGVGGLYGLCGSFGPYGYQGDQGSGGTGQAWAGTPEALSHLGPPVNGVEAGGGAAPGAASAPDFALDTASGRVSLSQLSGRVVLLDFWASWCGPCRLSFPWMNRVHERWQSKGLSVVAVNLDKRREDALRFLKEVPAGFTVAFDAQGQAAQAYAVKTMPSSMIIDRRGQLILRHAGFRPSDTGALEARLAAALEIG